MSAAQEPRAGEVLTAESVKLLREGDVLRPTTDLTDYCGGTQKKGSSVVVRSVAAGEYVRTTSPTEGHRFNVFTFVSRPSESSASVGGEDAGWLASSLDKGAAEVEAIRLVRADPIGALSALRTQAPARGGEASQADDFDIGELTLTLECLANDAETVRRMLHADKNRQGPAMREIGIPFAASINNAKSVLARYDRLAALSRQYQDGPLS